MSSRSTFDDAVPGADHKLSQLCRQVEEAVAFALVSSRDPRLRDLLVLDVMPLRGAARLRVRVSTEAPDTSLDELEHAVDGAQGYLRAEVAGSVHRKRAPELEVEVVPPALVFGE